MQFGGGGDAEEAAALAGDVEGFVDGFLHVAAGFGQDFAHFAGHVVGVFLFALLEELTGAGEDFGALGRGDQTPRSEGLFGGGDGEVHVFCAGEREGADDVGVVGGLRLRAVLPPLAGIHSPPMRL